MRNLVVPLAVALLAIAAAGCSGPEAPGEVPEEEPDIIRIDGPAQVDR